MAKPEWGVKRLCQGCGVRFYDLDRNPAVCPKCGAEFDPQAGVKSRRRSAAAIAEEAEKKAAAARAKAAKAKAKAAEDEDLALEDGDLEIEDTDDIEDEDDDLIEDASELGEDDTDVPGVAAGDDEER